MIPHQQLHHPQQNSDKLSYQPNELSNSSQVQQSSESDTQLQPQLLEKTLKTLRKLKKISKQRKLTELKSNNKTVNSIFKSMSELFFCRSKAIMQKKQKQKQLKQIRKQILKKVGIRAKQNLMKNQQKSDVNYNQQFSTQGFSLQFRDEKVQINQLKCYICKSRFTNIHHFYDCLCPTCGDFNYSKRFQNADLTGIIALVTGARIKIGFEIALKLLRDGASVIATTRFFNDALLRYQKQHDYNSWSTRLYIIQCDFTSSYQVQKMITKIKSLFQKIDILINNAAQTIVRPKQFYLQELVNSSKEVGSCLPQQMRELVPGGLEQGVQLSERYPSLYLSDKRVNQLQLLQSTSNSSLLMQIQRLRESGEDVIDHDVRDEFDQPLDKRGVNSWVQQLQDVSLIDCFTTQLVNSIVPFHLISQLKPLMKKLSTQPPSFIINVSSMQGVFSRVNKQSTHPHTNMAKAALNMITRTSSQQFMTDNIYMSSVDTGWVTEQNPTTMKIERAIPLDCVDGAMRVLDPIYVWKLTGYLYYGKFLKDYKQSKW